ncbi:hypothetical protein C8R44DRAFT_542187, partial [Mycena epipterygia]
LRIHHGAVDQGTITTGQPPEVMRHVKAVLEGMGVEIYVESEFKYRCIRAKQRRGGKGTVGSTAGGQGADTVYGDSPEDAGDEVRFSVELTRLDRLNDTYSLDIRRLKGNLRSYKFLYDTLRK